jgi:hypothetical protein
LAFIAGLPAGLLFGFMQRPALAQALGFGQPGQGFIFFHLSKNSACIVRSYLLQTVISKGDTDMTTAAKKEKILASIAARGWFTTEIYHTEAMELLEAGMISRGTRYFLGGKRKWVWVAP